MARRAHVRRAASGRRRSTCVRPSGRARAHHHLRWRGAGPWSRWDIGRHAAQRRRHRSLQGQDRWSKSSVLVIDTQLVTVGDLEAAARTLAPVAVRTPLLPADVVSDLVGAPIWIKPEMLQRGGAFKFRGAYNFLSQMDPDVRTRGVIAPSSGNHAQAVALAAQLFGVPATVVMPTTVTPAKRGGAERLGATIELAGTTTNDRMVRAEEIVAATDAVLVPPYDHPTIVAGQGTAGLEIVEDLPSVRLVLVPVGGGGLSAGVATAVKLLSPATRVVGVEPASAPKLSRARAAGRPVHIGANRGLADGLLAVQVGDVPFAHHERYVDDVVTVD